MKNGVYITNSVELIFSIYLITYPNWFKCKGHLEQKGRGGGELVLGKIYVI